MKHPNGYGSIFKLSGKRRKPWAVRVTAGWSDEGKQEYSYLGYYESRPEAMIALGDYNKSPYDVNAKKVTFGDIYELWKNEKYKEKAVPRNYQSAFNHSKALHNKKFIELRKAHMQDVLDGMDRRGLSFSTKSITKTLYGQLYNFALENDITDKNYAQFVAVENKQSKTNKQPFSEVEIQKIWSNLHQTENADIALIMIYTGVRPGELILIENKDINLKERYFTAGIKTDAGKNRIIPINKKILPLIRDRMSDKKHLILNSRGNKLTYNSFRKDYWLPLMEKMKMDHRAHECRHTFATLMDNANANKIAVKKIMGHASQDITEKVYTHKDINELIKAVDLI